MKKFLGALIIIFALIGAISIGFILGDSNILESKIAEPTFTSENEVSTSRLTSITLDVPVSDEIIACLVNSELVDNLQNYSDIPLEIYREPIKENYSRIKTLDAPEEIKDIINKIYEEIITDEDELLIRHIGQKIHCIFSDGNNYDELDGISAYIIVDLQEDMFWLNNYNDRSEKGWVILRGKCSDLKDKYLEEIGAFFVGVAYDTLVVDKSYDVVISARRVFIDFDEFRDSVFETYYYYDKEGWMRFGFREDLNDEEIYVFDNGFERIPGEKFEEYEETWIDPIQNTYDVWLCY